MIRAQLGNIDVMHAPGMQLQGMEVLKKSWRQRLWNDKHTRATTRRSDVVLMHCFLKVRKVYYRRHFPL
jgi:hypothetical protein